MVRQGEAMPRLAFFLKFLLSIKENKANYNNLFLSLLLVFPSQKATNKPCIKAPTKTKRNHFLQERRRSTNIQQTHHKSKLREISFYLFINCRRRDQALYLLLSLFSLKMDSWSMTEAEDEYEKLVNGMNPPR